MRTILIALALIVAIAAQPTNWPTQPRDHWRCREPMQFSAMLSILNFDTYDCVSTYERGYIAQDTMQQMRRLDLHVNKMSQWYNITIWQFYQTNTQFIYDRGQKSCQKTQTGPWTDTWSHNATSMGSVMSGLQLIERWFVADASDDILMSSIYMTPGDSCIPVRVDMFNTTGQSLVFEEHIFDWTSTVDEDLFQDIPDVCQNAKAVDRVQRHKFEGRPFVWM